MEIILCQNCKNYLGDLSCQAFKRIPDEILIKGNPHEKPLKDQQNDIVFEPVNEEFVPKKLVDKFR